ncbi:hypothetical protein FGU46_04640 [Methanobacterium sp. CWC-01]|nr:hypothetical protein FGU46_04640 [Methanobacterium sp. CWC-01]
MIPRTRPVMPYPTNLLFIWNDIISGLLGANQAHGGRTSDQIVELDFLAFVREQPRSLTNLQGLRALDPQGCHVILDSEKVWGYCFCKTLGSEGYRVRWGVKS